MLPHEREMTKRLEARPFTILGINSDESRSALKKIMADNNITWPNIYGGSPGKNEIANRWNVTGWPTIYVIDHEGRIAERDLREKELEEAVVKLLERVK